MGAEVVKFVVFIVVICCREVRFVDILFVGGEVVEIPGMGHGDVLLLFLVAIVFRIVNYGVVVVAVGELFKGM